MRSIAKTFGLAVVMAAGLGACAGDVADIDRTQPNKVKKEVFQGEWYFRPAVVDVQFNQGMIFEGYEGELERVKWEIREHEIVAYRSWALLVTTEDGTDGTPINGTAEEGNGDPDFKGSPVAKFPIVSHFDVIRDYNPATGEQGNILVENTTDRPWFERSYMRVNWSLNTLRNPYKFETFISAYPGYYVQAHEADSPHRAEITASNINITGRYMLESDIMTCWSLYNDPAFCGQSNALLKLSFKKIEGNRTTPDGMNVVSDYEPLYYPDVAPIRYNGGFGVPVEMRGTPVQTCYADGTCEKETLEVFERFGFFRHERLAYDDEFQWTRDGRLFLGHRWNIWRNSHSPDGTVIDAPFRQPGKVIYYVNVDFPQIADDDGDALAASVQLVDQWDSAFRETVALLKNTSGNAAGIGSSDIPRIYELRHNDCNLNTVKKYADMHNLQGQLNEHEIFSVTKGNLKRACAVLESATISDGDLNSCAPGALITLNDDGGLHFGNTALTASSDCKFTWQKQGDLRWSFLHWVSAPQAAGPLGYGPSAADPVTGEIISATANIYGAAIDTFASFAADVVTFMNNPQMRDDITTGENVRDHMAAAGERASRDFDAFKMQDLNDRMFAKRDEWFGSRTPRAVSGFAGVGNSARSRQARNDADDERAHSAIEDGLNSIRGSHLERELLINDDIKRAMLGPHKYQPGDTLSGDNSDFSPIDYMVGQKSKEYEAARLGLAKQSVMMANLSDFSDSGMLTLAAELNDKNWDEVYKYMRREIYRGVMAHEVGHTLGLRHNFQGSFDPLNYHAEFWDSYDPTTRKVEQSTSAGPTTAEKYMYSSIMDYDARFYADSLQGIGPYDTAAIKFGYGMLIETFKSNIAAASFENFLFLNDYHSIPQLFSGELGCSSYDNCDADYIEANDHYSSYLDADEAFTDARAAGEDDVAAAKRAEADQEYEVYSRLVNTYLLNGLDGTTPAACNEANDYCGIWDREHVRFSDLQRSWSTYYSEGTYRVPDVVPYKFCPDEVAGYSWVECQRYDKGATYREVTQDRMERYDSYYFFNNFKRDRYSFNDENYVNRYLGRLYSRYFAPMSNVYRYYLFAFSDMGRDKNGKRITLADFPVGLDWQAGGIEGLNFLTQIMEQPEPGEYCLNSGENTYRPTAADGVCASGTTMDIDLGIGKYYNTKWTDEYYYKATRLGSFWDKYAAMFAITDNEGFFYRDFFSYFDVGAFQLSYWSGGLKDEILDIFRGAAQGGTGKYAWRYDAAKTGTDRFRPLPVVDIYADDVIPDEGAPRIESAYSYTLEQMGIVWPMARFNSAFDYSADYLNYSRICLEGYADCLSFESATERYQDPLTGLVYVASWSHDPERAVAAEMLRDTQTYVDTVYADAKQSFDTAVTTYGVESVEAGGARIDLERVERKVTEKTSTIEIFREWSGLVGGGWR